MLGRKSRKVEKIFYVLWICGWIQFKTELVLIEKEFLKKLCSYNKKVSLFTES